MQSSPDMQGYALPADLHPPDTICYQVRVPNDPAYIQAFIGALYDTTLWVSWQRDAAHNGVKAAQVMKKVWWDTVNNPNACDCPPPPEINFVEDDMPVFRQEGCLLQTQCADGSWVTIYDPTACIASGVSQPPPGGDVPAGQCLEYDVTLQANGKWSLPVPVDNGDSITITGAKGLWSDGTINPWKCPDGNNGPLGICIPSTAGFDGADPAPAFFHMRLVALTSVQAYDAFNTTIGITGYGSPGQLVFQANDSTLSDNAGSISFHVKYCKAGATPVTLTYASGSGPTLVSLPIDITLVTADFGGGAAEVVVNMDRDVKATIVGYSGDYVDNPACPTSVWYYVDPLGGVHSSGCPHASVVPSDMPANVDLHEFRSQGLLGHQYQIVMHLEEP